VYSAQYLKQKYGSVKGNIAVLRGVLGQSLDAPRTNGFTDVLTKYPSVKVVAEEPTEWAADKASSIMQDWLVKYPSLTMVYGLSDTITVPAINVAERSASGRSSLFSSIDGDPIGIQAIQQGKMIATAMYGPIYAGFHFAEMANNMLKRYKSGNMHQGSSLLHSALVTRANVAAAVRASNLMSSRIHTFNFNRPLSSILALCQSAARCGH
jgi:ribose transport system substrate-binding protein